MIVSLRDIHARNIIVAGTNIKSLESISLKGDLHQTNVFVTLHDKADEELIASITETLTPELVGKISVSPAERAAREAEKILLTRQLQETTVLLEGFNRLLGDETPTSTTYLPRDIAGLHRYRAIIDKHLSNAALYDKALSLETILKLPRLRINTIWYRLSRFRPTDTGALFTPARIPTRFNPSGGFASLAFSEDISTATFEVGAHVDLAENIEYLKHMNLTQFRVNLDNVADLGDLNAVYQALGLDFSALLGMGFPDGLSVVQKICLTLVEAGFNGAIFPSRTTVGKKNLVLFPRSLRSQNLLTILFSGGLKTS